MGVRCGLTTRIQVCYPAGGTAAFYYGLCGYLDQKGLDDDEDEEVVCPMGFFPIMTIHQAKGLEFDFRFCREAWALMCEERDLPIAWNRIFDSFDSKNHEIFHPIREDSKWHDDIRQHYRCLLAGKALFDIW